MSAYLAEPCSWYTRGDLLPSSQGRQPRDLRREGGRPPPRHTHTRPSRFQFTIHSSLFSQRYRLLNEWAGISCLIEGLFSSGRGATDRRMRSMSPQTVACISDPSGGASQSTVSSSVCTHTSPRHREVSVLFTDKRHGQATRCRPLVSIRCGLCHAGTDGGAISRAGLRSSPFRGSVGFCAAFGEDTVHCWRGARGHR